MIWLNLLWVLVIAAFCSWFVANLIVLSFTFILRWMKGVAQRKLLIWLAALPWFLPLLTVASLLMLALAKSQGWIEHHCVTHLSHHPHFCLEHLPAMALQWAQLLPGFLAFAVLSAVFLLQMAKHYQLTKRSRLLRRLVRGQTLKNTLNDPHPVAFTLGIRKPLIFISNGLRELLTRRQLRMVVKHEIAHIRNRDVLKNTVFEILLGIHLYPNSLRSQWHLSAEIKTDDSVNKHFDALEIAEVLIKLHRNKVNSPYPVSISGGALAERIERLLNQQEQFKLNNFISWFFYSSILAFPVLLITSHHGLETFWGWLL